MSDLGYRNRNQSGVEVSVNSLDEYIRDLTAAMTTPNPDYEKIGVRVDGQYRQLNANLLQIENEYYSFIRPKRVARSGERPTKALRRAGVEYVEVRALDVSAFDPVGVNQNKLRFLEAFLVLCLTRDSPLIDSREQAALDQNHVVVARRGRERGLTLSRDGRPFPMLDWARELMDQMQGICELLDAGDPTRPYSAALAVQAAKLDDVALTPSARLIKELRDTGESFFELALRMSGQHKNYFLELYPPNPARLAEFAGEAAESLEAQRAIEPRRAATSTNYLGAVLRRLISRSSLVSGAAILRLAGLMQANPETWHRADAGRGLAVHQPVRAHLPVRNAARHANVHRRQRLVAGRRRPILGPQRDRAPGAFYRALPLAAGTRPAAAWRRGAQPRSDRGGADAPRRMGGTRSAGRGRQLRGQSADPARLHQA